MAYIPPTRGDSLQQYLDRRSRGADPDQVLRDGQPLAMRRRMGVPIVVCGLISVECWLWLVIVPWIKRAGVLQGTGYGEMAPTALGLVTSVAVVTMVITATVMLFTDVDSRGIHRPDWAGGDFIPWTSVTEVSTGASPEALLVRAGRKKINLSLMLFSNPAALVALIRRQVPADRRKNI